jgi:universal stress protein E
MRPIRRILVAVKDPKARSLPAVKKAAQLAHATGAVLELFHGIADAIYIDGLGMDKQSAREWESTSRSQYLRRLEFIAAPLRRQGLEVHSSAEWDYPIYEAIVRRAAAIRADLIVAERHATRHVAPWLLRFTDWELLRLSSVPVLLVKSSRSYRRPVVLAAVDPSHAFAKPSRLDAEILRQALSITDALRGTLHAVHAYVPMPVDVSAVAQYSPPDITERIEAHARTSAQAGFERVLRGTKIPRTRRHLTGRYPIDAITQVAREIRSAIVVMGAISRSGLKRAFIGNTAERILDQLACDVLVVKPPRFASHVARARRGARLIALPRLS